jgi:hypothetical protein
MVLWYMRKQEGDNERRENKFLITVAVASHSKSLLVYSADPTT